jgi:copper homeostasis protein
MERPLLEVIVQTLTDAREAARGGADRLEVLRSLADGGLTPPLALVQEIAAEVSLPLRVMIRENAGYTTHAGEVAALREAAAAFANASVDGVVIGFAHAGELELDKVAQVLTTAPDINVTFHRAFDQLRDPLAAIDALAAVARIDRILTSGGEGPPAVRAERLRAYQQRAGTRPTIIAGGGVDEAMLAVLARIPSVREVHVGRAAFGDGGGVSAARVARLRALIEPLG